MYKFILSSSSKNSIVLYTKFIQNNLSRFNISFTVNYLPKKIKRIALLKSTHVNKKSKEHFELRTFKSTIFVNSLIHLTLLKYLISNKPKSVSVKLKFMER